MDQSPPPPSRFKQYWHKLFSSWWRTPSATPHSSSHSPTTQAHSTPQPDTTSDTVPSPSDSTAPPNVSPVSWHNKFQSFWNIWRTKETVDWEDLIHLLVQEDVGYTAAQRLVQAVKTQAHLKRTADFSSFCQAVQQQITTEMTPYALSWPYFPPHRAEDKASLSPQTHLLMIAGVNGVGKTTTIGKIVYALQKGKLGPQGSIALVGADTFRSGAIEQLKAVGDALNVPVYHKPYGTSPGAAAFAGVQQALQAGIQYILIDTAGRLHNNIPLMDELQKVQTALQSLEARLVQSQSPSSSSMRPLSRHNFLVVDGTTGQNACIQTETFMQTLQQKLHGLVMTKLDSSFNGGTLMHITHRTNLPILGLGTGETPQDFVPFSPQKYATQLLSSTTASAPPPLP